MRLFIALPLPQNIKELISALEEEFKTAGCTGRYVRTENLHITLAFLGETEQPDEIIQIMKEHPGSSVSLCLGPIDHFKELYYVSLQKDEGLADLQGYVKELKTALYQAGYKVDLRPFKAHITLARGLKLTDGFSVHVPSACFNAKSVTLFQSILHPDGPEYIDLYTMDLD